MKREKHGHCSLILKLVVQMKYSEICDKNSHGVLFSEDENKQILKRGWFSRVKFHLFN